MFQPYEEKMDVNTPPKIYEDFCFRFHIEIKKYFGPSGQEYLTEDQPTQELLQGCYDTVDGIYDPKYKFILGPESGQDDSLNFFLAPQIEICKRKFSQEYTLNGRVILEIPTEEKIKWIKENCRKAWDEPTGYRPDLYENWNAGRRKDSKYSEGTPIQPLKAEDYNIETESKEKSKIFSFIKKVKKPLVGRFSMFGRSRSIHSNQFFQ